MCIKIEVIFHNRLELDVVDVTDLNYCLRVMWYDRRSQVHSFPVHLDVQKSATSPFGIICMDYVLSDPWRLDSCFHDFESDEHLFQRIDRHSCYLKLTLNKCSRVHFKRDRRERECDFMTRSISLLLIFNTLGPVFLKTMDSRQDRNWFNNSFVVVKWLPALLTSTDAVILQYRRVKSKRRRKSHRLKSDLR